MPDENCDTGAGHLLRLRSFLLLAVKEHDTEASIFNSLRKLLQQGSDATPDNFVAIPDEKAVSKRAGSVSRYMPHVRLGVFRDGVAMVLLDELQFLTQGDATARILKTLLLHTYLGPPLLYTANYDMVHRLLKRPQQYRDRLVHLSPAFAGCLFKTCMSCGTCSQLFGCSGVGRVFGQAIRNLDDLSQVI